MMVTMDDTTSTALIYGLPNQNTMQFLHNNLQSIPEAQTAAANDFYSRAMGMYDQFHSNAVLEKASRALSTIVDPWNQQHISHLHTLDQLQAAPYVMQRYLMADPMIRKMYNSNQLDGYSDTYVDPYDRCAPKEHYDYKIVTDGMMVEEGDDLVVYNYIDDLFEGDRELYFFEKTAVMNSWKSMHAAIANGDDPTDVYGGYI